MDKKLGALVFLFFLSFGIFATVVMFNKPINTALKAKEELIPSGEKSLILAWPLTVKDDLKKSQISVFVRNVKGIPLTKKPVKVSTTLGEFETDYALSDKDGKAVFNLSSGTPGIAVVKAVINNSVEIKKRISIKFN